MRWLPTLFLLSVIAAGCRSSRPPTCETLSVACDTAAQRPPCESITPADSTTYVTDPDALVGLVSQDEVERLRTTVPYYAELFGFRTLESDAIWVYQNSGVHAGLLIGDDGLIALRGCTAVALYPIAHYN